MESPFNAVSVIGNCSPVFIIGAVFVYMADMARIYCVILVKLN